LAAIVCQLDLQQPMQSVLIPTNVLSYILNGQLRDILLQM